MPAWLRAVGESALLIGALLGLAIGGAVALLYAPVFGSGIWAAVTAAILLRSAFSSLRQLIGGKTGVDLIAVLAMAGALALGQYLAGAIIGVMVTGGEALERFAAARARRELTALLGREPKTAYRRDGEKLVTVDVNTVAIGDVLLVKPGEVVPTDGVLVTGSATLDESALSGESKP